MLSTLNQRSNTHNSCEDSLYVKETEDEVYGIIADGCSTGTKSHFASQAICYSFAHKAEIYKQYFPVVSDRFLKVIVHDLELIMSTLGLTEMNFLSTLIVFVYDKKDKTLSMRVLGDGYYYINDIEYVVDQNNTPDYLGYYLNNTVALYNFLEKYPEIGYKDVDSFMICSDGIKAFQRSQFAPDSFTQGPEVLLFDKPPSKNYLERMWNTLKRDHYTLSDDLSIISYVS